jgi:outer membrane receptor for ferrienterochelin and colicins
MNERDAAHGKPLPRKPVGRICMAWGQAARAAVLLLWFPGATAMAAASSELLDLVEEENRVFAASRYAQSISDTPASVSVIGEADIRRYGYRTIFEALQSQAGFYDASSQWPTLGLRGVALPGDFNSRILFMVNGMPIYEPTYGSFFIEYLDIESIERIEVVRGPGSALYGSGAVLGVVNLVTKSGHHLAGTEVSLEATSDRSLKAYGVRGGADRAGREGFVSASYTDRDGRDVYLREYDTPAYRNDLYHGVSSGNDASGTTRLFGRTGDGNWWAQGLFVQGRKHDPLASYSTVFDTDRLLLRERFGAVETGLNRTLGSGALVTGRIYLFHTSEEGDYPYNRDTPQTPAVPTFINVSDLSSTQYGAEARYDRYLGVRHHLLAGVELKQVDSNHQVGDQPGLARAGVITVNASPKYGHYSVFAQDEVRLDERSQLFVGGRYDYYGGFSDAVTGRFSPRIAYVRHVPGKGAAKLIYGEAYRAPTIYESLYQDGLPAAETLWANVRLKPEVTRTLEALWEGPERRDLSWSVGAYLTRVSDYPVLVSVPVLNGVACALAQCNQYQNSGDTARVAGLEASVKARWSDRMSAYGSATLQRGRRESDGAELPSSPPLLLKGGLSRALPWEGWDAAVEGNFVSRVRGRLENDGSRTASAPSYFLLNAAINNANAWGGWRASLRAHNLLKRDVYTVASPELPPLELVPGRGRTFSLQLTKIF